MKDVIVALGCTFMILWPYLGVVIIGSFIYPIYKKYPIKKSLYAKAECLRDEIDNNLVAIYGGTYIVSLIGFLTCFGIFNVSNIMGVIIFDTWEIIFTIVFCRLAVNYIKRTYCQVFAKHQAIKF